MSYNVYTQHGCPIISEATPAGALCAIMGHRFGDRWALRPIDKRGGWRLDIADDHGKFKPLETRHGQMTAHNADETCAMEAIFKRMHLDSLALDLGVFVVKV